MNKTASLFVAGSLLLGLSCAPLFAAKAEGPKAKLMAKYDTNGNGVIDGDEVTAVRADFSAAPSGELKRFDTNKDGKLDDAEIAAMKAPGGDKSKHGSDKKKKSESSDATTNSETTGKTEKSE